MKLRNKKTGDIKSIEEIIRDAFLSNELDSLKSIDTNWEEIEPKEPLIKDEKIRKFVRDWAKFNKIERAYIQPEDGNDAWYQIFGKDEAMCYWKIQIHASYLETVRNDYEGETISIVELCGEVQE